MNMSNKKTILIIAGTLLLLGGITTILVILLKKRQEDKEQEEREKELEEAASKATTVAIKDLGNSKETSESNQGGKTDTSASMRPKFNTEGELSNPMSVLKGKVLYPKSKSEGGYGYANARSSSHVDNGGWDYSDNILKTFRGSTPIGRIVSETNTSNGGYSYRWFKVWFYHSISTWWGLDSEQYGWVRADVVTFK